MAPIHLLRLLEIYTSPAKESCPHLTQSTGSCRPLEELADMGLIDLDHDTHSTDYTPHGWKITEKGHVYVEALLNIPEPEQIWRVPNA